MKNIDEATLEALNKSLKAIDSDVKTYASGGEQTLEGVADNVKKFTESAANLCEGFKQELAEQIRAMSKITTEVSALGSEGTPSNTKTAESVEPPKTNVQTEEGG